MATVWQYLHGCSCVPIPARLLIGIACKGVVLLSCHALTLIRTHYICKSYALFQFLMYLYASSSTKNFAKNLTQISDLGFASLQSKYSDTIYVYINYSYTTVDVNMNYILILSLIQI